MKRTPRFYFKLFISVFSLSAFTIGGGYVIVPLMRNKYVDKLKWINEDEMLDLVAIAQSSPGAMAVNAAILVGYRTGGILGALVGVLGSMLPPLVIISLIYIAYDAFRDSKIAFSFLAGIKIGVAAVIVDVVIGMATTVLKQKSIFTALILVVSFVLVYFLKVNVIYVILGCIALGAALSFTGRKKADSRCVAAPEEGSEGNKE